MFVQSQPQDRREVSRTRPRLVTVVGSGIAALTVALGGASAFAAPPATAGSAGITWHKLNLIDGWVSSQGAYDTGSPAWSVSKGIVYLAGSLHQASGSDTQFATLPKAARPARTQYITVYTYDNTAGHVDVFPDGEIAVTSSNASDAQGYTSLAGIRFPAAGTARHRLSLINGWQSSQGAWNTGDPSYTVSGGVVYLSGALDNPGNGSTGQFAVLPKAARPTHVEFITVYTYADTIGDILIYPNGVIGAYGPNRDVFTSLAGISYVSASVPRHKLTLRDGWASGGYGTGAPAYSVVGGVVHLSGSVAQSSPGGEEFAVLPRGARPSHYLYIQVYTINTTVGTVEIEPNGSMYAFSASPSDATAFTSLAAISFPVNS